MMDEMAAMLSQVAGGLQQSFGSVFERVGESLEQSAQMMQMMNAMMEAAMLQSLVVYYDVCTTTTEGDATRLELHITVENRSQINIAEATLAVQVGAASTGEECALEQGLVTKTSVEMTFPLQPGMVGQDGAILLRMRSPGTHEWIQKNTPFRIPVLKISHVEAIPVVLPNQDGFAQAHSDRVALGLLRDAMRVSAFDALLTADTGYYRVHVPAGIVRTEAVEFVVRIHQTNESETGVRVAIVAQDKSQASHRGCHLLLQELEAL